MSNGSGESRLFAYRMPDSALLRSLALSGVDFGAFDWGTRDYSATAAATVSSATLTYEAFDDEADVVVSPADTDTVTDGHQVGLAEGANTVTITVTAPDGTVTVYTVTVDRAAESQSATVQFVPGEGPIAQQQSEQQQAEQQAGQQQAEQQAGQQQVQVGRRQAGQAGGQGAEQWGSCLRGRRHRSSRMLKYAGPAGSASP